MNLGPSGKAIWAAMSAEALDASAQALVLEFARCADTCDRLDGLAAGRQESWVTLVFDDMGEIHLNIDKILELRLKHQTVLRSLFAEVRGLKVVPVANQGGSEAADAPKDMLAILRKQKDERERQSG